MELSEIKTMIRKAMLKAGFAVTTVEELDDEKYSISGSGFSGECTMTDEGLEYTIGKKSGTVQLQDKAFSKKSQDDDFPLTVGEDEEVVVEERPALPISEDSYLAHKLNHSHIRYGHHQDLEQPGPVIRIRKKKKSEKPDVEDECPAISEESVKAVFPKLKAGEGAKVVITSTPTGANAFHDMYKDSATAELVKKLKLTKRDFESCIVVARPDGTIRRFPFKKKLSSLNNGILKMQVQRIRDLMEPGEFILNDNVPKP
jgi:hypothetical protein